MKLRRVKQAAQQLKEEEARNGSPKLDSARSNNSHDSEAQPSGQRPVLLCSPWESLGSVSVSPSEAVTALASQGGYWDVRGGKQTSEQQCTAHGGAPEKSLVSVLLHEWCAPLHILMRRPDHDPRFFLLLPPTFFLVRRVSHQIRGSLVCIVRADQCTLKTHPSLSPSPGLTGTVTTPSFVHGCWVCELRLSWLQKEHSHPPSHLPGPSLLPSNRVLGLTALCLG